MIQEERTTQIVKLNLRQSQAYAIIVMHIYLLKEEQRLLKQEPRQQQDRLMRDIKK